MIEAHNRTEIEIFRVLLAVLFLFAINYKVAESSLFQIILAAVYTVIIA